MAAERGGVPPWCNNNRRQHTLRPSHHRGQREDEHRAVSSPVHWSRERETTSSGSAHSSFASSSPWRGRRLLLPLALLLVLLPTTWTCVGASQRHPHDRHALVADRNSISITKRQRQEGLHDVVDRQASSSFPSTNPKSTRQQQQGPSSSTIPPDGVITVFQTDGRAEFSGEITLLPLAPAPANITGQHQPLAPTATVEDPSIVTNVSIGAASASPGESPSSVALRVALRMDGHPGDTVLRASVDFDGANNAPGARVRRYSAAIRIRVVGMAVIGADGSAEPVSASWRPGVPLGSYREWLDRQIIVVPLNIWPMVPTGTKDGVAVQPQFSVSFVSLGRSTDDRSAGKSAASSANVGAIRPPLGQEGNQNPPLSDMRAVCVGDSGTTPAVDAVFVRGAQRQNISFPIPVGCTVAINAQSTEIAVRLAKYSVGTFGFQMRVIAQVPNSDGGDTGPVETKLNFWFDSKERPPPLFPRPLSGALVLDPFGGEQLVFENVQNLRSPPRQVALRPEHLFMQLRSPGQASSGTLFAAKSVSPSLNESSSLADDVTFTTPSNDSPVALFPPLQQVSLQLFYTEAEPALRVPQSIRQDSNQNLDLFQEEPIVSGETEVAYTGPELVTRFASSNLPARGLCSGRFAASNNSSPGNVSRFASTWLTLPSYSTRNFSAFKAELVANALGAILAGSDGSTQNVRFLEFDDGARRAKFEILAPPNKSESEVRGLLHASIASGQMQKLSRIPLLTLDRLSLQNVSIVCQPPVPSVPPRGKTGHGKALKVGLALTGGIVALGLILGACACWLCFRRAHVESSQSGISDRDRLSLGPHKGLHSLTYELPKNRRQGPRNHDALSEVSDMGTGWQEWSGIRSNKGKGETNPVPAARITSSSRGGNNPSDRDITAVASGGVAASVVGAGYEAKVQDEVEERPPRQYPLVGRLTHSLWAEGERDSRKEYVERDDRRPSPAPRVYRSASSGAATVETDTEVDTVRTITDQGVSRHGQYEPALPPPTDGSRPYLSTVTTEILGEQDLESDPESYIPLTRYKRPDSTGPGLHERDSGLRLELD
jgi:hypothetical protein